MAAASIKRVPASTAPADILEILRADGTLVVEKLAEPAILDAIRLEIEPEISSGSSTVVGLAGKSRSFATDLLTNSLVQKVSFQLLTRSSTTYWGPEESTSTSLPKLSAATALFHGPGFEGEEGLVREDEVHHTRHPAKPETDLGIVFAGTALTKGAGSRKLILGSNLWDDEKIPEDKLAVDIEMGKGDALFFLGSTYTAPGPNTTVDKYAFSVELVMCGGWCRARENMFLSIPRDVLKSYPEQVQRLLGWYISKPYGGYVEMMDPLDWLKTDGDPSKFVPQDLV